MHRNHVYILYINVILGCLDELWHVHQHVPIPTFNHPRLLPGGGEAPKKIK